jgi:hypothetical protein
MNFWEARQAALSGCKVRQVNCLSVMTAKEFKTWLVFSRSLIEGTWEIVTIETEGDTMEIKLDVTTFEREKTMLDKLNEDQSLTEGVKILAQEMIKNRKDV